MSAPLRQTDFSLILDDFRPSLSAVPHAKISAAPTPKDAASKVSGRASTSKPSASSESAALVGSLLRTALISELGAMTPSRLRWRQLATPAGHAWFVLETLTPTTTEHGLGCSGATSHRLPTPMASDGMKDGAGGGAGSTYPFRQILATPRKTDADRGFRGDVLAQLQGQNNRHAGMLGTPTANPAPRGSVLRREKDRMTSDQDNFDRTPNMGEVVHFLLPGRPKLPTPIASFQMSGQSNPGLKAKEVIYPAMGPLIEIAGQRQEPGRFQGDLEGWATNNQPSDKWAYARQIAALLSDTGLTGPSQTLPITYGWMMGYPPGWLATALISAMAKGSLRPASSSKRSATPSSRKSPKPSVEPS